MLQFVPCKTRDGNSDGFEIVQGDVGGVVERVVKGDDFDLAPVLVIDAETWFNAAFIGDANACASRISGTNELDLECAITLYVV